MSIKDILKPILINGYSAISRHKPMKYQTVLFMSFGGVSYSDNPRPISEALHELCPTADIVWAFRKKDKTGIPSYIRIVQVGTKEYYDAVFTAGTWVNNIEFPIIPKRRGQLFIQTWHGDRAFKKVLYDSTFVDADYTVAESQEGFCDLAVAGSDYGERQYRSAFKYKGEVLRVGTPRNDLLIACDDQFVKKTKNLIGVSSEDKLLLYAPTLRRSSKQTGNVQKIQDIDIQKTLSALRAHYGGSWKCLVRAHPGTRGIGGIEYGKEVIDVSGYEDMSHLMVISDVLITDYSSCAGDFALLKRPIILYQSDREEYMQMDRTFYFNIDDSPYYVAQSQDELDRIISSLHEESVVQNCIDIDKFYGTTESGHAAKAVAEIIVKHIKRHE